MCDGQIVPRKFGASVQNQPHETDGYNPPWFWRFDRCFSQIGQASRLEAAGRFRLFRRAIRSERDGIKRSALTFRRLLLSRRPSTLWLDGRCDLDRCYPAPSNA